MPSMLEMMRLKNLFGQPPIGNDMPSQGGITGNMQQPDFAGMFAPKSDPFGNMSIAPPSKVAMALPAPVANDNSDYNVSNRMKEIYHPESAATDRFNELSSAYPDREKYKPSWARAMMAALSAFGPGGHQMGMQVMDEPFNDKLTDWKNKIGPAQQAATNERYSNTNERSLAFQTVSNELRQHALDAKEKMDETKSKIAQQRADVYQFKSEHPDLKIVITKGGNVQAINPKTGESHDTGIPTGSLTELDKMNLSQEHSLEQIGAKGVNASDLETQRQTGREGLAETRGWKIYNVPDGKGGQKAVQINEATGDVRDVQSGGPVSSPSGGGTKGELPTQAKVRVANAARQLAVNHPELAKFIKMGTGNEFTITPPSDGGFWSSAGPTKEQHKQITDAIYGSNELPITTAAAHGGTPDAVVAPETPKILRQRSPSTGQIRESKDGGKTWQIVSQ